MVSFGSKALPSRRHKTHNLTEDNLMAGEDNSYGRRKKDTRRKAAKGYREFEGDHRQKGLSGWGPDGTVKPEKPFKHKNTSEPKTYRLRKQVDPEMAKYFSEIANVIEGNEVDLEERSVICGNALEEARGKELELATDYIISHTLQALLEGCDVDHLCRFLQSCAKDFPYIAMDRSGSHVAETALKSLSLHLQDKESYTLVEETLATICKVIVVNPVDVMCNCYGSHVIRSLLCLCKGVPLDSPEFHATKSSTVLAERLNFRPPQLDGNGVPHQQGLPELLKFFVLEMFKCAQKDIAILQVEQYSSLVLQTVLKLLAGHDEELWHIIPLLLGCKKENSKEGNFIEIDEVRNIVDLMKETAFSHLMEVILEVAPETLYDEIFTKVFRNSLFEVSSHHCGNFSVQALVSHARCQRQGFIQPYVSSITSMETDHVLEAAKDAGGARVIEAFLSSNASKKHKQRLVVKLRGHFGELAMHPSGSFTVEKCFTACNVSLRETIMHELLAVRTELSKTKHGPHLLRRLDVDRFAAWPDQWRLKQSSKESAYKDFYATFGSKETQSSKTDSFVDPSYHSSHPKSVKAMRKEIDQCLASVTKLNVSGHKRHPEGAEQGSEKFSKQTLDEDVLKIKNKESKKKKNYGSIEHASAAARDKEPSQSVDKMEKKRSWKDGLSKPFTKKLKV
ncbi:pumilio homolog 23 isoform X3 [Vitis vinifera]|uniref:pumilio homolog 23 isoform X3 n=2 Tax=Vitis vinifera TaxID=29760 RepID=UPI0008FFB0AC|nr:pumilio homolog 23 isoform X3 [Vitis vinifera]|eukprot:XP_019077925.1 PREDICTED: pumilio homolog 23 isoform X4 [Vitis vinifera]